MSGASVFKVVGPSLLVEVDRSSWDDAELVSFRVCHDEEATVFVSDYLLSTEIFNPVLDGPDVGAGNVKVNTVLADLWLRYPLEAQSASAPEALQPNVRTLPTHDWSPKKAGPEGGYEFGIDAVDDYVGNLSAGLCHRIVSIVRRRHRSRRSGFTAEVTPRPGREVAVLARATNDAARNPILDNPLSPQVGVLDQQVYAYAKHMILHEPLMVAEQEATYYLEAFLPVPIYEVTYISSLLL